MELIVDWLWVGVDQANIKTVLQMYRQDANKCEWPTQINLICGQYLESKVLHNLSVWKDEQYSQIVGLKFLFSFCSCYFRERGFCQAIHCVIILFIGVPWTSVIESTIQWQKQPIFIWFYLEWQVLLVSLLLVNLLKCRKMYLLYQHFEFILFDWN